MNRRVDRAPAQAREAWLDALLPLLHAGMDRAAALDHAHRLAVLPALGLEGEPARQKGVADSFDWVFGRRLGRPALLGILRQLPALGDKLRLLRRHGFLVLNADEPLEAGDVLWFGYDREMEQETKDGKRAAVQAPLEHCGFVMNSAGELECESYRGGVVFMHKADEEVPGFGNLCVAIRPALRN